MYGYVLAYAFVCAYVCMHVYTCVVKIFYMCKDSVDAQLRWRVLLSLHGEQGHVYM